MCWLHKLFRFSFKFFLNIRWSHLLFQSEFNEMSRDLQPSAKHKLLEFLDSLDQNSVQKMASLIRFKQILRIFIFQILCEAICFFQSEFFFQKFKVSATICFCYFYDKGTLLEFWIIFDQNFVQKKWLCSLCCYKLFGFSFFKY